MAEPETVTYAADVFVELLFDPGPALLPAPGKTEALVWNRIPEIAIHRQLDRHHPTRCFFDLECQETGGGTDFKHPFPGKVVAAKVIFTACTQVPLPFDKTDTGDIGAVIKIALIKRADRLRLLIKPAFLSLAGKSSKQFFQN